jgi:hypothetical protein
MSQPTVSDKPTKESRSPRPATIAQSVMLYLRQLNSLATALPPAMNALAERYESQAKRLDAFVESHAIKKKKKGDRVTFQLTEEHMSRFEILANELDSYALATRNVPITFLVSLVSQYDAFIGNLLRNSFYLKPELLNASQRQLTFAELIAFKSVEVAREYLIEKEVDAVLRSSHAEQFDWMETRFGIPLRKELASWPCFIELTERRNLFVHCDGIVSNQYLVVCRKHDCHTSQLPEPEGVLDVDPQYFSRAYRCLFELSVKLSQVVWRKLKPDDIEAADDHLIDVCYDLLCKEHFLLAKDLLFFAVTVLKKHSSDIARRVLIINYCIALKALQDKAYQEVLKREDWSASRQDLQLAVAVLFDHHDESVRIMKAIGRRGKPSEHDYKTWPLFHDFRKTAVFKAAYRQVFRHDFRIEESTEAPEARKTREKSAGVFGATGAAKTKDFSKSKKG